MMLWLLSVQISLRSFLYKRKHQSSAEAREARRALYLLNDYVTSDYVWKKYKNYKIKIFNI